MTSDERLCQVLADWVRSQTEITVKGVTSRDYYRGEFHEFIETASTAEGAARQMCDRLYAEIALLQNPHLCWKNPPEIRKQDGFAPKYHCYVRLGLI